jgi:hypothetical protein
MTGGAFYAFPNIGAIESRALAHCLRDLDQ